MITQVGYEIDSQGNVGNETRRIEDLQLRFILLMTIINTTIEDSEAKQRLSKQAVKRCHKESGLSCTAILLTPIIVVRIPIDSTTRLRNR